MTKRWLLLLLALAILLPARTRGGAVVVWPTLTEQLKAGSVAPRSALEALIAAHQDFSLLRPEEARDKLPIPLWLRVLWRRAHLEGRYSGDDPTGGYPFVLKEVYEWMRLHQDLRPGPPERDTPPEPDEDITPKVIATGTDKRISGPQVGSRSESDIRVNYWNPMKIIGASNNLSGGGQAQFYSTDGGVTWGQTTLPLRPGDVFHSDPAVDWTSDGTAWATTIGITDNFATLQLKAYKSTDNGATWTFDVTFSGTQTTADKELMWVDHSATSPFKDNLYVIWHNGPWAYMNRRTGPGGSWQTPIRVSGAETTGTAIGADVKTNANGDVFAFWPDTGARLFVAKSTNGGASFGTPVQIATTLGAFTIGVPATTGRRASVYLSGGAYRTASKNLVYASWTDLKGGPGCGSAEPGPNTASPCKTRIWFARSTNGGATWSTPVMINDQSSLNDQFHQGLVVDETNGALGIIYYDTVGDPRRKKVDVWYQSSHDDGVTWSPAVKVTTAQTDETRESADPSNQFGDYNGFSGIAGQLFPSWTDRRNNAREEIWTAKIADIPCTPPGAPAIGTASSLGPNQVRITWGNGSPASAAFNLSRAIGTCAAPGPFTRIASALAGSPFTDGMASGGSTYAYRVTGTDASGLCESGPSACVQAVATGPCLLPPSFTGLASVTNQATAACGLALSWPAATPACAGPVTYDIYRSTAPDFTPSAANRIASHVTGTGYVDISDPLVSGTPFFYVVRAVDGSNGVEEGNSVKLGAVPTGPATYLLNETFEGAGGFDNPGWTHFVAGNPAYDWVWSAARSLSGTHSWYSPSTPDTARRSLVSPSFVPQVGSILSFWHTYSFDDETSCYDGGTLYISTDGGAGWYLVPQAAFLAGGFNGVLASTNPSPGSPAWCVGGLGPMTQVKVDLSAYAGMAIKVRWLEYDDTAFNLVGWYVDDVTVGNTDTCKINLIFSDSFESGNLPGGWSGTSF